MAGRVGGLRLFHCERSSMPPVTGHDKFGDGLACSRSHLAIPKRLRKRRGVARITDSESGDGFPTLGNAKDLAGFIVIETSHLVDGQAARSGFDGEQGGCRAGVV